MHRSLGVVIIFLSITKCFAQIYLSEIMFNPQGNERENEYVELFNAGPNTIDLDGYCIGDADRTSAILPRGNGTLLKAGQYALVLVENYYLNSTAYDSLIPTSCLLVTIEHTQIGAYGLANSRPETVLLYNPNGAIADSITYPVPTDDGIALERATYDAATWNWSLQTGGTPGFENTISPRPTDLAIITGSLSITPNPPVPGQSAEISVMVQNVGTRSIDRAGVILWQLYDPPGESVLLGDTLRLYNLLPDELREVKQTWYTPQPGLVTLAALVICRSDQNPVNDCDTLHIQGGYPPGSLIINEIMYAPDSDEPEWFEALNVSGQSVNLEQWFCYNSDGEREILCESPLWIEAGSYAVITGDTPVPGIGPGSTVIKPGYLRLRNDADSVALYDAAGQCIDRVDYSLAWGGNRGLSLERLSPNGKSQDAGNWTTCVDPAGHSAGKENSVYMNVLPGATSLTISPNPFSPDGDGYDDFSAISWQLTEQTSHINIRIFDIHGRMVRMLCNHRPCAATGTVFWDGCDQEGMICRIGIYLVHLENIEYGKGITSQYTGSVVLAKKL